MIIFQLRPCSALRRAQHEGVEYWLHEIGQPDSSVEVTLTLVVGGKHERIGRWTRISPASDETTARALILEKDALKIRSKQPHPTQILR